MKNSIAVFCLALLLCSSFSGMAVAREEKVVKVADSTGDWGYPSPFAHYPRGPGYVRMSFIFDTLIWKDAEGFVPALAGDWRYNETENTYVFHLRKGVTWHDGEKFSADDAAFTFTYVKEHPTVFVTLEFIKGVEVIDENTVKIYLEKPYAPFLNDIACTLPIIPEHIWKDIKEPQNFLGAEAVIGSGPFKLVDYSKTHGTYLYEAYDKYYLGNPGIDRIEFVKISEEMSPSALVRRAVNATSLPPDSAGEVKDKGFTVIAESESWVAKLMINHEKEPMSSNEFRQAIAYAINRDELVEISHRGHAVKGSPGLLPPGTPWYNPAVITYDYNPKVAKDILESLGYRMKEGYYWKDGEMLELELLTTSQMGFDRDAEIIARQLKEVGIKVNGRSVESKTLDSKVLSQQFDLAISGHGGVGGDPKILNRVILDKTPTSALYSKNETLNQLLEAQLFEMDPEKRVKIVREIQEIYAEELPALPLYYPKFYAGNDSSVKLYYTTGGIASGIPIALNKLAFVMDDTPPTATTPTPAAMTRAPIINRLTVTAGAVVLAIALTSVYVYKRRP